MKIYMTMRNADMTEGRGPMVNDQAFIHWQDAANYIDKQPGCMGRRVKWSEERYGDWEIKEIIVHEGAYDPVVEARAKVLAKLTPEERAILGIKE